VAFLIHNGDEDVKRGRREGEEAVNFSTVSRHAAI